jgi:hypothetical protein
MKQHIRRASAIVAAVLILVVARFSIGDEPAVHSVAVSSLDVSKARQGWGKPMVDKSVNGRRMSINAQSFEHGFGTHAIGRLVIDLHGTAKHFHALVGVDDDSKPKIGSVEFNVVGDGKSLWASGVMKSGQPAKAVDVDLAGVKELQLRVGDGGDGYDNDHADWADASIDYIGDVPMTVEIHSTEPTIAMPTPGQAPTMKLVPSDKLAATPPMGWNSYDGYGDSVTEAEMQANAKAVAEKLKPFGWQYVVVDYRWYDSGAFNNDPNTRAGVDLTMDENGRLLPAPNRFPSPLKSMEWD